MTTHDTVAGQPSAYALPKKRIRWGEQLVRSILFLAAAISVLTTFGIVVSLLPRRSTSSGRSASSSS